MDEISGFKKGELVTVSTGEYSDYCVNGLFEVLNDFDAIEQLNVWCSETGRSIKNGVVERDYKNENIEYMPWLVTKGFVKDVDYRELHTGGYGETRLCDYA